MLSELDRRYDEMLARVTGPGGPIVIGSDDRGQANVTYFHRRRLKARDAH